jgi:Predicted membrane protein
MKKKSIPDVIRKLMKIVLSREFITYGIAGVLTTVVNFYSYHLLCNVMGIENLIANAIAWVIAVTFAYVVNAKVVFLQKNDGIKSEATKVTKFFGARVLSLIVEETGMFIFVDILAYNNLMVKACLAVIVIIMNYVLSKLYIFK